MDQRVASGFLVLVLIQAMHSTEEYFGELWNVLPPATFLTGLVSKDLEVGFLIINIGLFLFGVLGWYFVIRKNKPFAKFLLWFWIILELINGIGHPTWSFMEGGYTPGVITAPFLLITSLYLIKLQLKRN